MSLKKVSPDPEVSDAISLIQNHEPADSLSTQALEQDIPSFTRALVSNVVGLVIILGIALLIAMVWQGISSTETAARQEVSDSVDQVTGRLQTLIDATEMTAASVERVSRSVTLSGATMQPVLEDALAAFEQRPELSYLGIILPEAGEYGNVERTATGEIYLWLFPGVKPISAEARGLIQTDNGFRPYKTYPTAGYDPRDRPFYKAAVEAGPEGTWMPAYQWIDHASNQSPRWGFSYVKALRDGHGRLTGVLDADFDVPALNRFVNMLSREYRSQIYIVELGTKPHMIGAPDIKSVPIPLLPELASLLSNSNGAFVDHIKLNGKRRWVAGQRIELKGGISWLVIASRSAPVLEAPLRRQLLQVLAMGAAFALALVFISFRMARRFGKPLAELEERVANIGKQASNSRPVNPASSMEGFRETQLLGQALDRMALAIEQQGASTRLKGALFDFTSAAIFSFDRHFKLIEWNAAAEHMFGIHRDRVIDRPVSDVVFAPDGAVDWSGILDMKEPRTLQFSGARGPFDAEVRLVTFFQEEREIHTCVLNDITKRKRIEQQLRQERDYADAVLNSLPGIFYHYGENVRLMRWNKNLEKISGYSPKELNGADPTIFFPEEEKELITQRIGEVFEKGETSVEANFLLRDGSCIPYYFTGVRFEHGGTRGFVGMGADISERKQVEERVRYLAMHDDLTGLANRHLIQDRIAQNIKDATENGSFSALLYVDLDRFKIVNDGYGHLFGNTVLKVVGERLLQLVNDRDTVARISGDEFLILLTGLNDMEEAETVSRKIIEAFNCAFFVQDREIQLSVSIGVSVFPRDGKDTEVLIDNADMAMYRAKDLGRNTYQFFTNEMGQEILRRVDLEIKLRGAVAAGQLQLVYQPKVNLENGRITGCEALLRWFHPELGNVSPAQFIPIAEDSGLIVGIGDWVLRTACIQARAWMDAGLPPICIAVNISVQQFLQQDVVAWVAQTLKETGLPAERLELELTESLIAQDIDKVTDTINQLKDIGVKLSIDDFGTGYSSLNYLKRFRVDTLKIDQSFVRNMLTEKEDATIVLAVIVLAHNLKFKVIAEGVETEQHCQFLQSNHCDEIQGYYFSKPVPAADFENLLRDGKRLQI